MHPLHLGGKGKSGVISLEELEVKSQVLRQKRTVISRERVWGETQERGGTYNCMNMSGRKDTLWGGKGETG